MVKLSNQKTPDNTRHVRRGQASPSRGMKAEAENSGLKAKIKKLLNKVIKKEETETANSKFRRNAVSIQSRDSAARNNYKSHKAYNNDTAGETDKRKRRLTHNLKTAIIYGSAAAAVIVAVIFTIISLVKNHNGNENLTAITEDNLFSVMIYVEGVPTEVYTEEITVGQLLEDNEINVEATQKCSYADDVMVSDGMEIFISSPMSVSIVNDGIVNSITMYGGKVSDVFNAMEIPLDDYDVVTPERDTIIYDGLKIQFTDVEIKQITVVEDVPYETEEGETSTVESGYYHVEQDGEMGAVEITYEVKLIDGIEQSREEIKRETIKDPITRIILWGTATPSSKSSSSSSDSSSSGDSSSYDDVTVKNPGEQATNPSVPPPPSDYIETMSAMVTAYTHTGSRTATGTWPRSTRTLENPGTCAVVPSTIPYGSLLYVTGYGYCIAEDTGGFRNDPDRWNQIDLFMNTEQECIIWGRRYDVKVYILRKGY